MTVFSQTFRAADALHEPFTAATLCRSLSHGGRRPVMDLGPAVDPPEHVAAGAGRRAAVRSLRSVGKSRGEERYGSEGEEGEIKGDGCAARNSLSRLDYLMDTVVEMYPRSLAGCCFTNESFVVAFSNG